MERREEARFKGSADFGGPVLHPRAGAGKFDQGIAVHRPGERIALAGQLVRVDGDNGFNWTSSLSREDTGAGACELVWVEQLKRLD